MKEFFKIVSEEHNLVNLFWFNFKKVDEGIYRSAQMTPWRLRKVIEKYEIRSILNLRAVDNYLYKKEAEICKELGVEYKVYSIASRTLPKSHEVKELANLLETLPKPILIHCKAGADRTGFVATLWLILRGISPDEAMKSELKWQYAYFPLGKAGKIKEVFSQFPGGDFIEWYKENRDRIEEEFVPTKLGEIIYNKILRRE